MLRPVPAGTVMPDGSVVASSWQPTEHLAADADAPTPGVTPAGGPALTAPGGVIPTAARGPAEGPGLPLASSGPELPPEADAAAVGEPVPMQGQGAAPQEPIAGPPSRPTGPAHLPPPSQPPVAGPAPHPEPHPGPHPAHPGAPGPDAPRECAKRALSPYIIEPPDILLIQSTEAVGVKAQPITGTHLVRPDGTIGLGIYGSVYVAGLTLEQARDAVAAQIKAALPKDPKTVEEIRKELQVDVAAFNSKFYYVITNGAGYGEQAFRIPITGNETVLDAISQIGGLPPVAAKNEVWVARANCHSHGGPPQILPVDWVGVSRRGEAETNYQIFPGDRIYVQSDKCLRVDTWLSKHISPVERVFGVTLLGATMVNAIKGQTPGTVR
jgi:polysaccharide biosynthesis/export protein